MARSASNGGTIGGKEPLTCSFRPEDGWPVKCPDCGSKDVAQRRAANGQLYLIDTKRPHSIFCPGRKRKNGAKRQAKAPRAAKGGAEAATVPPSPAFKDALEALTGKPPRGLGFKPTAAREALKDIPEGEPEAMVLAALTKMGADAAS